MGAALVDTPIRLAAELVQVPMYLGTLVKTLRMREICGGAAIEPIEIDEVTGAGLPCREQLLQARPVVSAAHHEVGQLLAHRGGGLRGGQGALDSEAGGGLEL